MSRARACLNCGEPDVVGLCGACWLERELDRLADSIAGHAELLASQGGASVPVLPVCEHLRAQPRRRLSQPELELALEWTRLPEPDPQGWWWSPTRSWPAPFAEAFAFWGQA